MGAADIINPPITGDVGNHLDTHALVVFADHPDLAGEVEITENIEGILRDGAGVARTDQAEKRIAGGP